MLDAKRARWQRRWIVLQGRTLYWFKGAQVPSGQLEITEGATVTAYTGQDHAGTKAAHAAEAAHPYALVVATPALAALRVCGLVLQMASETQRQQWSSAITGAIGSFGGGPAAAPADPNADAGVLKAAQLQGWLHKRAVHAQKERWSRRWCALHGASLFWFTGYYKIKGALQLTRGTRLRELGPRQHAFAISTPEMERAGLYLGFQARDAETKEKWMDAIGARVAKFGQQG